MEQRQHVEQLVAAAEVDARFRLRHIGEDVAVGEDDAFRRTFGAGSEQDHRRIVGLARDQRTLRLAHAAQLVDKCDRRCGRPRDRRV